MSLAVRVSMSQIRINPKFKSLILEVTKQFGKESFKIDNILSEPAGIATSEVKRFDIDEFEFKEGNVLDLSRYWDQIIGCKLETPVLSK